MIPKRYENAKYDDIPSDIRKYFEAMRESRRGLYIYGGIGTGKTHIAYALVNVSLEKAKLHTRIWNTTELFHEMRLDMDRSYNNKILPEEDIIKHRGIVILDDIGSEKISDWVMENFYLIVNSRYNECLPTIFTSNLPIAELAERISDRTVSRIVEMCDIFKIDGEDRRIPRR